MEVEKSKEKGKAQLMRLPSFGIALLGKRSVLYSGLRTLVAVVNVILVYYHSYIQLNETMGFLLLLFLVFFAPLLLFVGKCPAFYLGGDLQAY